MSKTSAGFGIFGVIVAGLVIYSLSKSSTKVSNPSSNTLNLNSVWGLITTRFNSLTVTNPQNGFPTPGSPQAPNSYINTIPYGLK